MTQLQAAILSSRLICAWLIYGALSDLLGLIRNILLFVSGVYGALINTMPSMGTRLERSSFYASAQFLFEFVLNIVLAVIFYRCGPRLLRFLLGSKDRESPADEPQVTG